MSDSLEHPDGSLFLDVPDADEHRAMKRRLEALDVALPAINRAAEKAQQAAHDPARWRQVCEQLAEVRRRLVCLKPEGFPDA